MNLIGPNLMSPPATRYFSGTESYGAAWATSIMNEKMKSQQQHTIPRWLLENFSDREGVLHAARRNPRTFFKTKPKNIFRRRDYYAAREIGESLENKLTKVESLCIPYVKSMLCAARKGIDKADLSDMTTNDIRGCGLFLVHLLYRSPNWVGEDFFSGMETIRTEMEKIGKDMNSVIREESLELLQNGEFVITASQVDSPKFIIGDCGPFVSLDTELGVDNETRKRNEPNWVPAQTRIWMALSSEVALGVAMREVDAKGCVAVIPNAKRSANWVDHFNEICARHSRMIAGASETYVCAASQKAWPIN